MYDKLTILGQSGAKAQKALETFPSPFRARGIESPQVTFLVEEFTSVCPVTGQPDYGTIEIMYVPRELCLESKSLKLYLQTFRNEGIFFEALSAEICEDLFRVLSPEEIRVTTIQSARGGIALKASSSLWGEK